MAVYFDKQTTAVDEKGKENQPNFYNSKIVVITEVTDAGSTKKRALQYEIKHPTSEEWIDATFERVGQEKTAKKQQIK